jgi:3',5'-cyclic AMP phosphodiesterase CpdA
MDSYSRREFLRVAALGAAVALVAGGCFSVGSDSWGQLPANLLELRIDGVDGEFCFLHVTDNHLCHCDARDVKLKERMARRAKVFREPAEEAVSFVRTVRRIRPDFVANTGDFLDRPTAANIDAGRRLVDSYGVPFYFAIGNHEWGKPAERTNRDYWHGRFAALTKQNLDWYVKEMCGVNLLFIDDSDYQISAEQLVRTRALLDTGRPCMIFMHIPVGVESLLPATIARWKRPIVLRGKTPSTLEFCEMVESRAEVKAIFAGHLHFDHVDELGGGGRQYVTGPGCEGRYRFVRVRGT